MLFTPWLAGLRSPVDDRFAPRGWHNLALHTTRADLTCAVLEGVAFNTRWLLAAVEKFVGKPSTRCGSSVAAPSRTCGARSMPMSRGGGSSGSLIQSRRSCAARRSRPPLARCPHRGAGRRRGRGGGPHLRPRSLDPRGV